MRGVVSAFAAAAIAALGAAAIYLYATCGGNMGPFAAYVPVGTPLSDMIDKAMTAQGLQKKYDDLKVKEVAKRRNLFLYPFAALFGVSVLVFYSK